MKGYEGDTFPNAWCRLCRRVYSLGPGYRDDPTTAKTRDLRPFAIRCNRHDEPVALCIVDFAGAAKKKMKLVCPVEGCLESRETELSPVFQKGY
jgi:hypothetical protein